MSAGHPHLDGFESLPQKEKHPQRVLFFLQWSKPYPNQLRSILSVIGREISALLATFYCKGWGRHSPTSADPKISVKFGPRVDTCSFKISYLSDLRNIFCKQCLGATQTKKLVGAIAPIPKIIALRSMAAHSFRMLYRTLGGFCAA